MAFKITPEHHNPANALKSARIHQKDRPKIDPFSIQDAEALIAALHRDWGEAQGNYDEFRFFTGLRPSEQIALVVTDYDAVNGVLSITKARVSGIDRDRTKIAEDRRVVLNAHARSVLERQLRLREQLQQAGRIHHPHLFFHANGDPIRRLYQVHRHWRLTLQRLAIRYRRPYTARHSSVSWDLMLGGNPLYVAQQHGHRILTMLTTYAAWTEGSLEADVVSIRRAMESPAYAARNASWPLTRFGNGTAPARARAWRPKLGEIPQPTTVEAGHAPADLAMDLPIAKDGEDKLPSQFKHLDWRSGRDSKSLAFARIRVCPDIRKSLEEIGIPIEQQMTFGDSGQRHDSHPRPRQPIRCPATL